MKIMRCSEVKQLLSAYHDDQLSSEKRISVTEHMATCNACANELRGFRGLSDLATGLTHPEPPTRIWQQLENQLDAMRVEGSGNPPWRKRLGWTRRPVLRIGLATAAAILLTMGWLAYGTLREHHAEHQMALVFGQYLEKFARDPQAAQQFLLASYEGCAVDADLAVDTVGYRPVVADGMPEGYSVASTCVMKMPCCTCVQCLFQRNDGTTVAVFEHDNAEAVWFGDRPETEAICNGKRCSMVALDDKLAATWRRGKRHITVVGARDTEEVDRLVAWFDNQSPTAD